MLMDFIEPCLAALPTLPLTKTASSTATTQVARASSTDSGHFPRAQHDGHGIRSRSRAFISFLLLLFIPLPPSLREGVLWVTSTNKLRQTGKRTVYEAIRLLLIACVCVCVYARK